MDQLNNFVIFSFFDGKDKWKGILLMMVFPYINQYVKKIYYWVLDNYFNEVEKSITLTVKTDKGKPVTHNPSYSAVCWYSEKYLSDKLICEEHSKKGKTGFGNPIFYSNDVIKIVYDTEIIRIYSHINENEKRIVMKAKSLVLLKKFLNETNTEYSAIFHGEIDPRKIYTFNWKQPKYTNEDGAFESNPMLINKTFQNVHLNRNIKGEIQKDIDTFLKNEKYYLEKGIPYKRGYLLYGCPGTGKNSLVYAVAREYKRNLYILNLKEYNVEKIKGMVRKIPSNSIVFLDEIDMNIHNDRVIQDIKREENKDDKKNMKSCGTFPMSGLMEILDGYEYLNGCLIFLTTNHKEVLDPALIRPGRIDIHFHLDKLNNEDIQITIKNFTGFDIDVPKQVSMTSSQLINQILLPNKDDKRKIEEIITSYME